MAEERPFNREERRRMRFGAKGDHVQDDLQRQTRDAPASAHKHGEGVGADEAIGANEGVGADEATTGSPDGDVTRLAGPGTGGATESEGQTPHHEGAHIGVKPKG